MGWVLAGSCFLLGGLNLSFYVFDRRYWLNLGAAGANLIFGLLIVRGLDKVKQHPTKAHGPVRGDPRWN